MVVVVVVVVTTVVWVAGANENWPTVPLEGMQSSDFCAVSPSDTALKLDVTVDSGNADSASFVDELAGFRVDFPDSGDILVVVELCIL